MGLVGGVEEEGGACLSEANSGGGGGVWGRGRVSAERRGGHREGGSASRVTSMAGLREIETEQRTRWGGRWGAGVGVVCGLGLPSTQPWRLAGLPEGEVEGGGSNAGGWWEKKAAGAP